MFIRLHKLSNKVPYSTGHRIRRIRAYSTHKPGFLTDFWLCNFRLHKISGLLLFSFSLRHKCFDQINIRLANIFSDLFLSHIRPSQEFTTKSRSSLKKQKSSDFVTKMNQNRILSNNANRIIRLIRLIRLMRWSQSHKIFNE